MTPHPFDLVTTPTKVGGNRFELRATSDWFQGRGAYGGVTAAALARALTQTVDAPQRALRSLTVHFAAPVSEAVATIETTVEREGTFVSHTSARMTQGGKTAAFCTATFGADRNVPLAYSDMVSTRVAPDIGPPQDVPEVAGTPLMPTFTKHFEFRFGLGHAPFSGAQKARMGGYMRAKPPRLLDVPLTIGLLDAWPPSMLARMESFNKGAASIDFTVHLYRDFPLVGAGPDDYYLFDVHSHWCNAGYAEEHTQMYEKGGTLVAECRQMIALF